MSRIVDNVLKAKPDPTIDDKPSPKKSKDAMRLDPGDLDKEIPPLKMKAKQGLSPTKN